MDGVIKSEPVVRRLRTPDATGDVVAPFACMPPEAQLAMPEQSLSKFDPASRRKNALRHRRLGAPIFVVAFDYRPRPVHC